MPVICDVNKIYHCGKNLESFIGSAQNDQEQVNQPKLFSNIRWIGYSYDCMKNTQNNFKYMYQNLTK